MIIDIIEYNINNYIRLFWVWCWVGLWLRASYTRFTLKMTHFWVTLVKNELKPYNLQGF